MAKSDRLAFAAVVIALAACAISIVAWRWSSTGWLPRRQLASPSGGEWLKGSPPEQVRTIEKQLRGLDVTMAEIGYRFTELYFAGQDGNWDYAKYQAEKIDLALRLALERRPKRAQSAQPFLEQDLPFVRQVIEAGDRARFPQAMDRLRAASMKCHTNENVPYFTVELPEHRISPVRTIR